MKYLLILLLLPIALTAQFVVPAASPPATSSTIVGYTELAVEYHRPGVRGRKIFGELIPWGQVWRAGANENSVVRFGQSVTIADVEVPAGAYSLFVIPEAQGAWTWIINRQTDHWGARGYDKAQDVVRLEVEPKRLRECIESLEFRWLSAYPQSVDLALEWEWTRIVLPIGLATDAEVARRATEQLNPAADPKDYYAAARYYLDNGLDLQQAKAWMDRWAAADEEQFGRMRYQAIIEYKLGHREDGRRLMERSLALARTAGNAHYVRMNAKSLQDWTRKPLGLSADSLLTCSIRYHDPQGNWSKQPHALRLAESRPSGGVNHTQLTLYPANENFAVTQFRGKNNIELQFLDGVFTASHQGKSEQDPAIRKQLGLTKERALWLRDYYTYLYGLPMKLRDPGTLVQPQVHEVWFNDKALLELEVHYAPETGKDIWFFYFDPDSFALEGYAFYHEKDGPGTGEYIILEGEAVVDEMRLPAERNWYYTHNNLYLGSDEILR